MYWHPGDKLGGFACLHQQLQPGVNHFCQPSDSLLSEEITATGHSFKMSCLSDDFASGHLSLPVLPYCLWDTSHIRCLSGQRLAGKLSFVESVFGVHFLWSIFGIQNVVNSLCEQQLPSPPAPVSDTHVGWSGGRLVCFCPSDPG